MYTTLQQYCARASEIKSNISKENCTLISLSNINNYMVELSTMQQYIEDTLSLVKTVHNELTVFQVQSNIIIQPSIIQKKLYNENMTIGEEYLEAAYTNIVEVNSLLDIPEIPLYWVSSLKQYAINIGGMILRGNIGNIYNASMVKKNKNLTGLVYCKNGNSCDKILYGRSCKYYHDPLELQKLKTAGLVNNDQLENQSNHRNFINTSWMYTEYPEKIANANMRHFGSRECLKQYIQLAKIEDNPRIETYCKNYADQCMHDILVMYVMHSNKLKSA